MLLSHRSLNRQDHLRKNPDALNALWANPAARVVLIQQGLCLVTAASESNTKTAQTKNPSNEPFERLQKSASNKQTQLVANTRIAWQAVSQDWQGLSYSVGCNADDAQIHPGVPTATQFADLRVCTAQLSADDASLLAYAKGLSFWHSRTRFCSLCGSGLTNTSGGHVKQCSNDSCNNLIFPRTDPAVIMLVTRVDKAGLEHCLLGRNPVWPAGMYSTLAGFVEPGESLENAVIREVHEESGIEVDNARYMASQPWPFPRSIMLGFEARATSSDIKLNKDELEDAQWFTRDDLKTFGRWGDNNYRYQLPRGDSIASYLINHWLNR